MCRFLIVKSKREIDMSFLLEKFADMAEKSRTTDGDRQADGWGVGWMQKGRWKVNKSLRPVWEDKEAFGRVQKTDLLVSHARSATYESTRGDISFNQPYVSCGYSYVFNGHLRGVAINEVVEGRIGSEKIWYLIKKRIRKDSLKVALESVYKLLEEGTDVIFGMNIAVVGKERICLVSTTTQDDDYFTLWKTVNDDMVIICSEPLAGGFDFKKLPKDHTLEYTFN